MVTNMRLCDSFCPIFRERIGKVSRQAGLLAAVSSVIFLSGCVSSLSSLGKSGGTAVGALSASTSSVTFGAVPVGQTASTSVSVVNQGSASVVISQVSVSGQSFSANPQGSLPVTINPNSTLNFIVQFDPASAGTATGQLTIASSSTS